MDRLKFAQILMENALIEPNPQNLDEVPILRPGYHDEQQLWSESNEPLTDTTGAYIARKMGPMQLRWGAN